MERGRGGRGRQNRIMFYSRLQSVLLGSLCLAALASGCWAYDAKCEACIVYHEQLFEKLCRGGVVPELVNHDDANMCELDHVATDGYMSRRCTAAQL